MTELFDPKAAAKALRESRKGEAGAAVVVVGIRRQKASLKASTANPVVADLESRIRGDFRVFLTLVWRWLDLPEPTPLQLSIAWWLQHGPERAVIMAFRGCAKSWITAAFALWTLYCDPQKKVLVVSASLSRATKFVQFCLALIREMPELRNLIPKPDQRQSGQEFDVGPARPDQSPSLKAAGITGQITGSRADLIVPDDIEIPANSMTVAMREKIAEAVKEFDAILKPGGIIKYLGTPQVDDSLYTHLEGRGYTIRIWPALHPNTKERARYGTHLAPFIANALDKSPHLAGTSTEPTRFSNEDLAKRARSYGKSGFQLQFMLDTSLADADRYPLKLRDLVVMALDPKRGPDAIAWGNDEKLRHGALACLGHDGDGFYGPANVSETFSKWTRVVAAIDSSGRGLDETSVAIVAELHGVLYHLYTGAWRDGFSDETLKGIATALVRFGARECFVESNFGDGMFAKLLGPHVTKAWELENAARPALDHGGTELIEMRSGRVQKEERILSVLEPVIQSHRLVVNKEVVEDDYGSIKRMDAEETRHRYSLIYQLSHLTKERDCLVHDDRVEALAIAVAQYAEAMGVDPLGMSARRAEERLEEELEKLLDAADEVGGWPKVKKTERPASVGPRMRR